MVRTFFISNVVVGLSTHASSYLVLTRGIVLHALSRACAEPSIPQAGMITSFYKFPEQGLHCLTLSNSFTYFR